MTRRPPQFSKFAKLLFGAAIICAIFPLLGLFASSWWAFDLFNHPQRQYLLASTILATGLLALRSYLFVTFAAIMILIPLARIAPTWRNPTDDPGGEPIRLVTFNVLSSNTQYEKTLNWIKETDPDIIFLPEVNESWAGALAPLRATHPHFVEHFAGGNFGLALYSKFPIQDSMIKSCGEMDLPLLIAKIATPGGNLTLFGAHPMPPIGNHRSSDRDRYLKEIADSPEADSGPCVLLGDLNATRWSRGMRPLFDAGWIDTSQGHGTPGTWMKSNPLIAIPIDHVMFHQSSNGRMHCRNRWVGPDLGSDHRPVIADIVW